MTFRAVVERAEAATVLAFTGEFDMDAVPAAEAAIHELLDDSPGRLIVDLSGLSFLDSSGIRLLLQSDAAARWRGVEMSMTRPPESVWQLLERFHLDERLPFVQVAAAPASAGAAIPVPADEGATRRDVALELHADRRAPALARHAATEALPDAVRDAALLLISEVVTNAVRHGCTDADDRVRLSISQRGGRVRVEVQDPGPGVRTHDPGDELLRESGWGLVMVERLAATWGTATDPSRVWFELEV